MNVCVCVFVNEFLFDALITLIIAIALFSQHSLMKVRSYTTNVISRGIFTPKMFLFFLLFFACIRTENLLAQKTIFWRRL